VTMQAELSMALFASDRRSAETAPLSAMFVRFWPQALCSQDFARVQAYLFAPNQTKQRICGKGMKKIKYGYIRFEPSSTGSPISRLPLHCRPRQLEPIARARVLNTAHAADQVEGIAVDTSIFDMLVIDVNRDHPADHQAAARRRRRKIENLMDLTFKTDRRFSDSRRTNNLRGLRRDLRQFELVDARIVFAAGDIHSLKQIASDDVYHEFFGLANVA
jgi:hypothetical protein